MFKEKQGDWGRGEAVCASVWRGDGGHGSEYLLLDWM